MTTRPAWWADFDLWHGHRIVPLRMCCYAARGLWSHLLCAIEDSEAPGFLLVNGRAPSTAQLARLFAGTGRKSVSTLLEELAEAKVFYRTGDPNLPEDLRAVIPNGLPVGTIFEPRMARAAHEWRSLGDAGEAAIAALQRPSEKLSEALKRANGAVVLARKRLDKLAGDPAAARSGRANQAASNSPPTRHGGSKAVRPQTIQRGKM